MIIKDVADPDAQNLTLISIKQIILMHKYLYLAFCTLVCLSMAACGNNTASENTGSSTASENADAPVAPPANGNAVSYPSLPIARMQALYDSTDYIDFVFYYANFSMNQSNDPSIKATLGHVSNEVPTVYPDACQPIGSLFFQSGGKEIMQAELYFSERCVYFIWLENGQRTYANKMTPAGFQFYQQVFSQQSQ